MEVDVVLDVHDDFLDRGGRVRLQGGPEGATSTPTDAPADLVLPVGTLGPLLFGSSRASTYARAGRAEGAPDVLRRVDAAFAADREPHARHRLLARYLSGYFLGAATGSTGARQSTRPTSPLLPSQ